MIRRNNKEKEQRKKIKFISQNIEQKAVMENLKLEICHLTNKISRERERIGAIEGKETIKQMREVKLQKLKDMNLQIKRVLWFSSLVN